jgi:hypothetical protein
MAATREGVRVALPKHIRGACALQRASTGLSAVLCVVGDSLLGQQRMEDVTTVFVALHILTTLASEQESRLEALRNALRETIEATRVPFSDMSYNDQLQVSPNGLP